MNADFLSWDDFILSDSDSSIESSEWSDFAGMKILCGFPLFCVCLVLIFFFLIFILFFFSLIKTRLCIAKWKKIGKCRAYDIAQDQYKNRKVLW